MGEELLVELSGLELAMLLDLLEFKFFCGEYLLLSINGLVP